MNHTVKPTNRQAERGNHLRSMRWDLDLASSPLFGWKPEPGRYIYQVGGGQEISLRFCQRTSLWTAKSEGFPALSFPHQSPQLIAQKLDDWVDKYNQIPTPVIDWLTENLPATTPRYEYNEYGV